MNTDLTVSKLKSSGFFVGPVSENGDVAIVPFTNGALKEIDGKEKMLWATVVIHSHHSEAQVFNCIDKAVRQISAAVKN